MTVVVRYRALRHPPCPLRRHLTTVATLPTRPLTSPTSNSHTEQKSARHRNQSPGNAIKPRPLRTNVIRAPCSLPTFPTQQQPRRSLLDKPLAYRRPQRSSLAFCHRTGFRTSSPLRRRRRGQSACGLGSELDRILGSWPAALAAALALLGCCGVSLL